MAYAGTTSTAPQVPQMAGQGIIGSRTWVYLSTHISSDIEEPNFFTDGDLLGMKSGDMLRHVSVSSFPLASTAPSSGIQTLHQVVIVGSTTTRVSTGTTLAVGSTA
jgi:hypothetical protein